MLGQTSARFVASEGRASHTPSLLSSSSHWVIRNSIDSNCNPFLSAFSSYRHEQHNLADTHYELCGFRQRDCAQGARLAPVARTRSQRKSDRVQRAHVLAANPDPEMEGAGR